MYDLKGEYKDFDGQSCNYKGWKFEMTAGNAIMNVPYVLYEGNATDFEEWKLTHNRNSYDGILTLPNGKKLKIEMKYRSFKIFDSWFMESYIPRDCDIYVVNDVWSLSYWAIRVIKAMHRKVMSIHELVIYLGRLVHNILHPSKYVVGVVDNRMVTVAFTVFLARFFGFLRQRFKWKNCGLRSLFYGLLGGRRGMFEQGQKCIDSDSLGYEGKWLYKSNGES